MRQLQENFSEKKKQLFQIFVNLEKNHPPRSAHCHKVGIAKAAHFRTLNTMNMSLYQNPKSQVKIAGVGMHEGSVMSHVLFIIIMEDAAKEYQTGELSQLLYADDRVITAESKVEVIEAI